MSLTSKELEIVNKYLSEDKINDILNFQRIINFICDKFNVTEDMLSSKSRKRQITNARMYLVALTIKIFKPKFYEKNGSMKKERLPVGYAKMISIAINKSHMTPSYYYKTIKQYLEIGQIDIDYINKLEVEILQRFEYIY